MSVSLTAKIEAILYVKGQPVPLDRLAEYAGCDRDAAREATLDLMDDYAHRDGALEVVETRNGYSLQLRESLNSQLQNLLPAELGVGALRTLAAIALKGPILQTELVDLRGSGAYEHVKELMALGFVRRRRHPESRSFLVQVTDQFHRYFQIESLSPLSGPDTQGKLVD